MNDIKTENLERAAELQKIKVGLQERTKGIRKGIRTGGKLTKDSVKVTQKNVIDIIDRSGLSLADKGKFNKTIKNIQTSAQLAKAIPVIEHRIERLGAAEVVRNTKESINAELKTIKPKIQSGKKVGKFTAETQAALEGVKQSLKIPLKNVERELNVLRQQAGDNPTPEQLIKIETLDLMNRGDNNSILKAVKEFKAEGETVSALRSYNRFAQKEANVETMVDVVSGGQKLPARTDVDPYADNFVKRMKRWLDTRGLRIMHLQSVADILSSNDKDSKSLKSPLNDLLNFQREISKEKRGLDDRITEVNQSYSDIYGLTKAKDIARKIREDSKIETVGTFVDGHGEKVTIDLSKAEARKRHAEFQDKTLDNTWESMGYTEEMKTAISDTLTVQDKQFVDWQIGFYNRYYARINEVYKKMYGVNLGVSANYTPIRKQGYDANNTHQFGEFMDEAFLRNTVSAGSLKGRITNSLRIKEQSDVIVMANYIGQMEHFINFAEKVREVRDVTDDGRFMGTVEAFYGKQSNEILTNFMNDIAANGKTRASRNETLESLMSAMATGVLAIKPSITIKQLTSAPAFAAMIPTGQWMKYSAEFYKNPVKNTKFLLKESADLKLRGTNVVKDMMEVADSDQAKNILRGPVGFSDIVSLNIMLGDKAAIVAGGYPIYKYNFDKAIKEGKSKAEAQEIGIFEFENAYNLTQQTTNLSGLSEFQRGGAINRLFGAFLSSPNLYLQMEAAAIRGAISGRTSMAQAAKIVFIFHVLLPNLFVLVGNLFDDDKLDEQDHLLATILGPLTGIFVVGDMLESVVRYALGAQVFGNEAPIYRMVDEINKLMKNLKDDDADDIFDVIRGISALGETIPGVAPAAAVSSQGLRSIQGAQDILNGDYREGVGLMFGYTDYAVGKRDKKGETTSRKTVEDRLKRMNTGTTSPLEDRLKRMK